MLPCMEVLTGMSASVAPPRPTPEEISSCPVDATLDVLAGRWKGTILWRLSAGPMRTGALRRSIPGISERMLIRHLHDLVADGILTRTDAGTVPPHVTYEISAYGRTLAPIVEALCTWGRTHQGRPPAR